MGVRVTHLAFGAAVLFPWAVASSSWAQTYTVSISSSLPNLGKIAMPASASTFTVAPATGGVTQTGLGAYVNGNVNTRGLVTVTCTGVGMFCNFNEQIIVTTQGAAVSPMSTLSKFSVANNTGATFTGVTTSTGAAGTFTLSGIGNRNTATFYVGMDIPLASSGTATGNGSAKWTVTVLDHNGSHAAYAGTPGTALATTFRPISVSKSTDLVFGTIVKPPSVSGTVSMDSAGNLTVPAGAVATHAHNAANFMVYGESAQAFTVAVTPTFTMTSGANTLAVTTTPSSGSFSLGGSAIGSQGSYSLGVGGSFPLSPATPTGAYAGSFTVTAAYN